MDIQTPLSALSSPLGPKVMRASPLPRPPCPSSHRNISHSPEQTPPNVAGLPQSQVLDHPSCSNHSKLCRMFETFKIGVRRFAFMRQVYARLQITTDCQILAIPVALTIRSAARELDVRRKPQ